MSNGFEYLGTASGPVAVSDSSKYELAKMLVMNKPNLLVSFFFDKF